MNESEILSSELLPVTVLSGFLGAGAHSALVGALAVRSVVSQLACVVRK